MTSLALFARRDATTLIVGFLVALTAQATTTGSGRVETESRDLTGFSAIAVRGEIELIVRQGQREAVQVSAEDNLLPLLQTALEGTSEGTRTLLIRWKSGESVRHTKPVVVTVDLIRLSALSTAGSGDVTVEPLKTQSLTLSISGSSDAKFKQLDAERFNLSIVGSGDVRAAGKAARLEVSIAGSGDARLRELVADDVSVSIAGSGDASVHAMKSLAVSIAGSGNVDYGGSAVLTRRRVAGSGSVQQRP